MIKQTAENQVTTLTIERVSILLDGEMDRSEAAAAIAVLCADPTMRRHWHELHRVGDALRSEEVAAFDAVDFCSRVASLIAAEPTVLAPRAAQAASGMRRYWVPGLAVAASAAAVAFVAIPLMRAPAAVLNSQTLPPPPPGGAAPKSLPTIVNARGLNP